MTEEKSSPTSLTYRDAGVDIDGGADDGIDVDGGCCVNDGAGSDVNVGVDVDGVGKMSTTEGG